MTRRLVFVASGVWDEKSLDLAPYSQQNVCALARQLRERFHDASYIHVLTSPTLPALYTTARLMKHMVGQIQAPMALMECFNRFTDALFVQDQVMSHISDEVDVQMCVTQSWEAMRNIEALTGDRNVILWGGQCCILTAEGDSWQYNSGFTIEEARLGVA